MNIIFSNELTRWLESSTRHECCATAHCHSLDILWKRIDMSPNFDGHYDNCIKKWWDIYLGTTMDQRQVDSVLEWAICLRPKCQQWQRRRTTPAKEQNIVDFSMNCVFKRTVTIFTFSIVIHLQFLSSFRILVELRIECFQNFKYCMTDDIWISCSDFYTKVFCNVHVRNIKTSPLVQLEFFH